MLGGSPGPAEPAGGGGEGRRLSPRQRRALGRAAEAAGRVRALGAPSRCRGSGDPGWAGGGAAGPGVGLMRGCQPAVRRC